MAALEIAEEYCQAEVAALLRESRPYSCTVVLKNKQGPARAEVLSFDPLFARKIDPHQNVLLLKHFEYRRTLGYVGLVFVVRTLFTSLDVHSVPA